MLLAADGHPALLPDGAAHFGQAERVHVQRPQSGTGLRLVPLLQLHPDEDESHIEDFQQRIQGRNQAAVLHFSKVADRHLLRYSTIEIELSYLELARTILFSVSI